MGRSTTERKGGRRWRRLRERILRAEPLCRMCRAQNKVTVATEVDHITPLHKGGEEYDEANCQPLCHDHHADKTTADAGGRVRVTVGLDGWPVEG